MTLLLALLVALAPQARPAAAPIAVSAAARSIQPGEIVMLTIAVPEGTDRVSVRAFDRDLACHKLDGRTWQALVGIDLGAAARSYPVTIEAHGASGVSTLTYPLRVVARAFPTRRLRVNDAFVNPPAAETARITREAAQLAALWNTSAGDLLWTGAFVRPVPGPANSAFGTRSFFNGQLRSRHSGGDFLSPQGTPVRSPGAGNVALAADLYFSGNTIVIDHGAGLFSLLAHLSVMDVKAGDHVAAGDLVGKVGATGRVTGPHLHWAVRAGGARVDPLSLLDVLAR